LANIKRWTREEEQFLRENYLNIPNQKLAEKFGVTVIAIQRKLSRLGCVRQKQKKWNGEEEEYLRRNFMKMTDDELAKQFDVTSISIRRKLHRLGLSRLQEKKRMRAKTKAKDGYARNVRERIRKAAGRNTRRERADIYKINQEYKKFQKIYHEIWKKEGVVKDIINNNDGRKMMLVDFEDIGVKKLVMGLNV